MQGMDGEAKQDASCSIKKTIRCSIKTSWRCFSEHWALFSLGLLLYLVYKSSPGFFAFLLSTSPVIICTILLLGILLSCGSTHVPEIHEDGNAPEKTSAPEFGSSSRNVHIKVQQKRFPVATLKENIIRESSFGRTGCNRHADLDENVPFLKQVHQGDERLEKVRTYVPSLKQDVDVEKYMKTNAENESEDALSSKDKGDEHANLFDDMHHSKVDGKETDQGRVPTDEQSSEVADVSEHKAADGSAGKCKWGRAFSVRRRKKLADIKIEAIPNSAVDNQAGHPLCSPFTRVGSHDNSSGFDPDNEAEGHSPDAPTTDTARALDETEMAPPSGAGCSCNDDPYNNSNISSLGSQPESDITEVADNSKAKDDGEQNKGDGAEPAFLWTADDEKSVMDLGYSETERNRRLEVLMVRRKSRKNIVFELDGMGGQVQPLSISARRTNPFADDPEIPGSAPPVLHPRMNPFDFLTEQQPDDGGGGGGFPAPPRHDVAPQEPMPAPRQDALFTRHESFTFGRPPQGQGGRRFKPCFVLDEFGGWDEASAGGYGFQRQFSDRSVSRLSAVSECDTVSSVGDQEHNELIRSYIRGVRESPSPSPLGQEQDGDDVDVRPGNECSDGIGFVDGEALNAAIC